MTNSHTIVWIETDQGKFDLFYKDSTDSTAASLPSYKNSAQIAGDRLTGRIVSVAAQCENDIDYAQIRNQGLGIEDFCGSPYTEGQPVVIDHTNVPIVPTTDIFAKTEAS